MFFPVFLTKPMVSHKCFTTQFPLAHIFREENLITYAKKSEGIPTLSLSLLHPSSNHSSLRAYVWLDSAASRSPVYCCRMCYSVFLPQILFHCKMMPISKASRRWLWSGSFVVPAGKVIWVGSYFRPVMLPGILQGAATVL